MTDDSRKLKLEKLRRNYRQHPELYANQVLGVAWWQKQVEVAQALLDHKRVFVKASHSVGKSFLAGGLVDWFYDVYRPGIALTTAPTKQGVVDILWKEVRTQRKLRPGLQPKAPRMESRPDHFAAGLTARDDSAFQGRHEERVFIVFDEATGIAAPFWDAAEGMMTGDGCYWLAILNPTDTSSRAYDEEVNGDWHVITISALEHPNIAADLAGVPAPFPKAVRLSWLLQRIKRWCTPIPAKDHKSADFEFPPGSGVWYRPGPLFEGRVLGRWPTNSGTSVWTEAMWKQCLTWTPEPNEPLELGCDVAIYGDDYTSIFVRRGNVVLHHETHNGWDGGMIAGRLKELTKQFARKPNPLAGISVGEDSKKVLIKVDDCGVGGRVMEHKGDWNMVGINAGATAHEPEDYPNARSELWFVVADRADTGRIDLSRLSDDSKSLIRRQAMAPKWKLNGAGQRVVEPKDETKKRIGRSPDDMDGLNICFYGVKRRVFTAF